MTEAAMGSAPTRSRRGGAARLPERLGPFPPVAWAYWFAVVAPVAAGIPVALVALNDVHWARFALLAVAASVAQLASVRMSSSRRTFHPAIVFVIAGALVLPPQELILMCVLQHLPEWLKQRYRWYVQPFNVANYVFAALAAWEAARFAGGLVGTAGHAHAVAGLAAAAAFVAVNRLLLAPMIVLSRGLTLRDTGLFALEDVSLEVVLALLAVPLVALWSQSVLLSALCLAPLVLINVTQRAQSRLETASETISRQNESLEEAHAMVIQRSMAALEALSATVDARDAYTAGHSKRVRSHTLAIAAELGIDGAELEALGHAALFHDIGKIGVPDAVLLKEGPLTPLEWLAMKSHPDAGARIIERLGYLDEIVPVIRYHHERLDGDGYPGGLSGEDIPLGARIVHVADTLDALTTSRVYRDAMSFDDALAEIKRGAGTDFCPHCVAALERAFATLPRTAVREVAA
ncbi:MAG TPA: HD-GYP domain-containing protein [Gaiellaceae bacterium]|nr:HD-GYP domain-containing protein [Gaiellaceae bacterium]